LARFTTLRRADPYGGRVTQESYSVSRQEAGRLLGYSEKTIDRLCARGELRKAREGGRAPIERASIHAYQARLYDHAEAKDVDADPWAAWLPELANRQSGAGGVAA
jgi:hypothetical protein